MRGKMEGKKGLFALDGNGSRTKQFGWLVDMSLSTKGPEMTSPTIVVTEIDLMGNGVRTKC